MNEISCKFIAEDGSADSCGNPYEMIIDDKLTNNYFDVAGFVLSAEQDGVFPMFAGWCSTFGCCGAYMEVRHEKDTIVWQKFLSGQCHGKPDIEDELTEFKFLEDFIVRPPLVFRRDEYKKLAETLVEDIKMIPEKNRQFRETLERYKSGDLSN